MYQCKEDTLAKKSKEKLEPLRPQVGAQQVAMNVQADVIWFGGAARRVA